MRGRRYGASSEGLKISDGAGPVSRSRALPRLHISLQCRQPPTADRGAISFRLIHHRPDKPLQGPEAHASF